MVKKESEKYEYIEALPVSTKEDPTEAADLLKGGSNSKHVDTFDVEFDVEDDLLLDWQKHGSQSRNSCGCCSALVKLLPEHLQQPPDWWWRMTKTQRKLLLYGSLSGSLLLLALSVLALASLLGGSSSGSTKAAAAVQYQPQYVQPGSSPYCSWSDLYLPKVIQPTNYKLHIKTDMAEPFLVEGEVQITLKAAEATPCVVLHSHGIDITSVALLVYSGLESLEGQQPVEVQGVVSNGSSTHQQVVLQFPEAVPLPPLQPVLRLTFSYTLQEGLDGFYRSSFIDAANETKVMASTQFESIAARKAFPCFDEPALKAAFDIKVTAPGPPMVVLSNMPLSHTHEHSSSSSSGHDDSSSDLIAYHFERSPPMSTYLVAWVVGELSHVEMQCPLNSQLPAQPYVHPVHGEDEDDDGEHDRAVDVDDGNRGRVIPVRVWGTSDRASQFGHAKEVACHALQTMERLLQVALPLPKMDLVAIPNFAAGAMENWGLLTYRETALLVDDAIDDMKQRYDIATTVAHETAHQWFGDLVTLDDWTELWLNEGFATYFEVVAAHDYKPAWGYFNDFLATFTSPGLEADGVATSHPLSITRPTRKLSEIDNWFDDVSYAKGGAVLRMLRAWLNRANGPMLGFSSSSSSDSGSEATAVAGDGSQHMRRRHAQHRRLQQTMQRYLPNGTLPQDEQEHERPQDRHPTLTAPTAPADNSSGYDDSSSSSGGGGGENGTAHSGSGSSVEWWTQKAHFGGATSELQQQAKGLAAAAAAGSPAAAHAVPAPAPAPAATTASTTEALSPSDGSGGSSDDGDGLGLKDPFLAGLRTYLQDVAYGSSNYSVLWQHLAAASGQPVGDMMETWTLRRGFPILSVSLGSAAAAAAAVGDGQANQQLLQLEQVAYHAPRTYMVGLPFYPDMYCNDWTDDVADSSWWIPVALQVAGSNAVEWHSFSNCSSNVTLKVPHNGWVLANAGRYGFFRVNYSEPLWAALAAAAVDRAQISSIDFAGLLDDAYSLSLVRQVQVTVFLSLARALGDRFLPEHAPWNIGLGWLQRIADVLSSAALLGDAAGGGRWRDCLGNLKKYVTAELTGPFIAHVEVPRQAEKGLNFKVNPHDSPELRLLRPKVLTAAGFLGHTEVMAQAVQLLQQAAAGQTQLAPDVTKAVYSLAVGSGDEGAYNTVVHMYEQALDAADKERALKALSRVSTTPLIAKTLDYALSPAVRSQDFAPLLVSLAKQGGLGFNMTWEFIITRADDIMAKYGGDDVTYSLGRPLNTLAKLFVDEGLLNRLRALDAQQPKLLSPTFIEEANEARIMNTDWLRFQGVDACAWLASAAEAAAAADAGAAGGGGG